MDRNPRIAQDFPPETRRTLHDDTQPPAANGPPDYSWSAGFFTVGHGNHRDSSAAYLVVQSDANVVIYRPDGRPAWNRHEPGSLLAC